jgi:hypothetical protein
MLDWQRDILPVLRATYDLMDELRDDALDGDVLVERFATDDRDEKALYDIFWQIKRGGYAEVRFAGGMTIGLVQPTERACSSPAAGPSPARPILLRCCKSWTSASPRRKRPKRNGLGCSASETQLGTLVNRSSPACSVRGCPMWPARSPASPAARTCAARCRGRRRS